MIQEGPDDGAGNGCASSMGLFGFFFCKEHLHAHKIPCFWQGGILGSGRGGPEMPICFYGRGNFSE